MKSVPPRGSGWVVDSELVTADISHSGVKPLECERKPTRYRVVVLTSSHCIECDGQPSIMVMLVKLH